MGGGGRGGWRDGGRDHIYIYISVMKYIYIQYIYIYLPIHIKFNEAKLTHDFVPRSLDHRFTKLFPGARMVPGNWSLPSWWMATWTGIMRFTYEPW